MPVDAALRAKVPAGARVGLLRPLRHVRSAVWLIFGIDPGADLFPGLVMQRQQHDIANGFKNRRHAPESQRSGNHIHGAKGDAHVQADLTGGFSCCDHDVTP